MFEGCDEDDSDRFEKDGTVSGGSMEGARGGEALRAFFCFCGSR